MNFQLRHFSLKKPVLALLFGLGCLGNSSLCQAQTAPVFAAPVFAALPPFDEAQRLLDNEQFPEAAQLLARASQKQPGDYRLLLSLAQARLGASATASDVQALKLLKMARSNLSSARPLAVKSADKRAVQSIVGLQSAVTRRLTALVKPPGQPRAILPLGISSRTRGARTRGTTVQPAMISNLPLQLPGKPVLAVTRDAAILAKEEKNRKYPTHNAYDELGKTYVELGFYDDAARNFRTNADMFRRKGNHQAATIHDQYAARYESDVRLFVDRPLNAAELKAFDTRATLEPPVGTYIGAFIDRDERLKDAWQSEYFQTHRRPEEFAKLVGKPHATYFMYARYGGQFPRMWLDECKAAKVIPHLAWEPQGGLDGVKEDEYLINFAKECGKLNWPIFLRYASEMNGAWTPWHGNPELYKEKFRLVNRVFKKYAPKVATIWCVNSVPVETVMDYYPGDDACDWVGINLYSVPFYGEKTAERPGDMDSPTTFIEPIYAMFKDRKPIALCEYASSQKHFADAGQRADFAVNKMALLYSSLPRLFPRIKMVSWFDVNNILHAPAHRRINNYSLTENGTVLKAYQAQVGGTYFLPGGATLNEEANANLTRAVPRPVAPGQNVRDTARFSIWVKTPVARPLVFLEIGQKLVYAGKQPGTHVIDVDTSVLPAGRQPVTVYIFSDAGKFITKEATSLTFGRTRGSDNAPFLMTGTIKNYLVNRAGLVSALQLQGAGDESTLHFEPTQAQKLMDEFGLNAKFAGWVKADEVRGKRHFSLLSAGETKPATFPDPSLANDAARLLDEPQIGAESRSIEGKLTGVVTDDSGRVLALELDGKLLVRTSAALREVAATPSAPVLNHQSVVRVEVREETPLEGEVSTFASRFVASEIEIGGRRASVAGLPVLTLKKVRQISAQTSAKPNDLRDYLWPLPQDSGRTRGGGLTPILSNTVRPW